ncbi:4'-phosphopantetheinyl transferase family protein [Modestobacter marinus]|uniref:4'-phosphopantetheinyl transferase family protein n=1 Tax=Modestobacter marinus TaxID=477641 RepID=UPI0027E099EC|nr:4'-phosphopantetheinyl transferase superfamily protein [Modestobacter marinus]
MPDRSVPFLRVWRVDLADPAWDVERESRLLAPAERARADLGVPAVRTRRVLVRSALRRVLGGVLDLPAGRVPLESVDGRPVVAGAADLHVSCSASGDVGLVAVSAGVPVGVDVQRHDPGEACRAFAEDWLSTEERTALAALPAGERLVAVTRCWTQKEAVLKGIGVGLRRPPGSVDTPVRASGRVGDWVLAPVAVPRGCVASVAVRTARSPAGVPTGLLHPPSSAADDVR